jgi:hypothetical protein
MVPARTPIVTASQGITGSDIHTFPRLLRQGLQAGPGRKARRGTSSVVIVGAGAADDGWRGRLRRPGALAVVSLAPLVPFPRRIHCWMGALAPPRCPCCGVACAAGALSPTNSLLDEGACAAQVPLLWCRLRRPGALSPTNSLLDEGACAAQVPLLWCRLRRWRPFLDESIAGGVRLRRPGALAVVSLAPPRCPFPDEFIAG